MSGDNQEMESNSGAAQPLAPSSTEAVPSVSNHLISNKQSTTTPTSGHNSNPSANNRPTTTGISSNTSTNVITTTTTATAATRSRANPCTTRIGRFKDKRPEPLNLNKSINQEIPLDLSVKSAGVLPSGSNIFNLSTAGQWTTLETPRIAWQDNEALRLFSSSANANQILRLSSLAGESPPITPGTPFLDLLYSPTLIHAANIPGFLQDSSASLQSIMSARNKQQQYRLFDDNLQTNQRFSAFSNKLMAYRTLNCNDESTSLTTRGPRRSCSTDNISSFGRTNNEKNNYSSRAYHLGRYQQQQSIEKQLSRSSVSPLVLMDVWSNKLFGSNCHSFPSHKSESSDSTKTSQHDMGPMDEVDGSNTAMTPTSVANATKNLLKIHLNSPTYYGDISNHNQSMIDFLELHKSSASKQQQPRAPLLTDANPSDPLLSAAYCQQYQQQNQNSTFADANLPIGSSTHTNATINRDSYLTSSYQQSQQQQTTISSSDLCSNNSISLNTPTLISPNQLKSCFLPSPLLSPMSSVFELPSPILMFSPASKQAVDTNQTVEQKFPKEPLDKRLHLLKGNEKPIAPAGSIGAGTPMPADQCHQQVTDEQRLAQLVTPAKDKSFDKVCGEVEMEVDDSKIKYCEESKNVGCQSVCGADSSLSHILPSIQVSTNEPTTGDLEASQTARTCTDNCKNDWIQCIENQNPCVGAVQQGISPDETDIRRHREVLGKRALSPQSFQARVNQYCDERLESCSAPPHMGQPKSIRPKIKSAIARSGVELGPEVSTRELMARPPVVPLRPSQVSDFQNHQTQLMKQHSQLYPAENLSLPTVQYKHQLSVETQNNSSNANCWGQCAGDVTTVLQAPSQRSSSAEPRVCNFTQPYQVEALRGGLNYPRYPYYQPRGDIPPTPEPQHPRQLAAQQHQYQAQQAYQPQALSLVAGCNFSQSSHQLNTTNPPTDYTRIPPVFNSASYNIAHQCQSVSADELNRRPQAATRFPQPNNSHYSANFNQQHLNQNHHLQNPTTMSLQMTHSSSVSIYYGPSQQQPPQPAPRQPVPESTSSSTLDSIHLSASVYERPSRQLLGGDVNPEKRASSAEMRAISRSDSLQSCSSADLCLRSSSAASGSASKKYHCDQCPKAFTRSDMLTRHRRLHSGDRPFQCTACKQEFSRSDHLSTHMRTHTGEKPYKCKLCFYSACRKDMITRHIKAPTGNTKNL